MGVDAPFVSMAGLKRNSGQNAVLKRHNHPTVYTIMYRNDANYNRVCPLFDRSEGHALIIEQVLV